MQANNRNIKQSSNGNLRKEEHPLDTLAMEFIEKNIYLFMQDFIDGLAEKGLNSNFALCMNSQITNELFIFHHEDVEDPSSGISPSIDIGVYPRAKGKRGKKKGPTFIN